MDVPELDLVDRGILHRLQQQGRMPITSIADAVDVSDNTVRNRLESLEERGIVRGYTAEIDYENAGLDHRYTLTCSGIDGPGDDLLDRALEISGVVGGQSLLRSRHGLLLDVVGGDAADVERIVSDLEDRGLAVTDARLVRRRAVVAFDGFDPDGG